jgi:signal transduction histidine kinase
MRLAEFIREHRDEIAAEWEAFARTMPSAAGEMTDRDLRDEARRLVDAAAAYLESPRTHTEQKRMSKRLGSVRHEAVVSEQHTVSSMETGSRLAQVLAEHRALRASVVRLWEKACPRPSAANRRELTRFHEAVDKALADALNRYTAELEQYRDQFLAILGHDLRNPLSAISMSATSLSRAEELNARHSAMARRIVSASGRMSRMVSDLLDLTRTRLGDGIPLVKRASDLGTLCRQVLDEMEATYPGRRLTLEFTDGDLTGNWDSDRVAQIISNLIANALQHGDATKPVAIRAASTHTTAILTVHNQGKAIPRSSLKTIFEPLVRLSKGEDGAAQKAHLGLGLFIVRQLVVAHGGKVLVTSTDGGTTFTVLLPRYEKREPRRADATNTRQSLAAPAAPPPAG